VDLLQWLRAQLDEDERIARGADPGPWGSSSLGRHDQAAIRTGAPTSLIQFDGSRAAANGLHVARHDPARVLREIDAKRRMLDECERAVDYDSRGMLSMAEDFLRLLAIPFADRPGFREEWRP
jgi:uncharacterized protein DUF6221